MQIEWKKLNASKTGIILLKEEADLKKAGWGEFLKRNQQ